jgi:hypothetical protein
MKRSLAVVLAVAVLTACGGGGRSDSGSDDGKYGKSLGSIPPSGDDTAEAEKVVERGVGCLFDDGMLTVVQDGKVLSTGNTEVDPDPNGGDVFFYCDRKAK